MSIAAKYTKHPKTNFRHQIRDFVRKNGPCTGAEVRHGIAKDTEAARFIVGDVSMALNAMTKSGILHRDKQKARSHYTVNERHFNGAKYVPKVGRVEGGKKRARVAYNSLRNAMKDVPFDLRDDVLAEAYLRISESFDDGSDLTRLVYDCKKFVNKQLRGGWREDISIDSDLTETGFTLHDLLSEDDPNQPHVKLFVLERQVDHILRLARLGYEPDQFEHMWWAGGTTWGHRSTY